MTTSNLSGYQGPALLHVGYIKTGTTYLQEAVFADAALGFALVGGTQNRALLVNWFRAHNDYDFDAAALTKEMRALEAPIRSKGLIPVWSEETLLGDPLVSDYCGPSILAQLKQLDLNVKVLITIRRQEGFALSAYREALRYGRYTLNDFIGTGAEALSMRPILRPEFLFYDVALAHYQAVFGKDNCTVLPLEMLRRDPVGYTNIVCGLMGQPDASSVDEAPRNVGRGATALAVARVLNGFYNVSPLSFHRSILHRAVDKLLNIINRLAPASLNARIEGAWRKQIDAAYENRFADSNRRLEGLTDLDLRPFDYQ